MYTVHSTCISQIVCWLDPKEGGLVVVSQQPFTRLHTWSFLQQRYTFTKILTFFFCKYISSINYPKGIPCFFADLQDLKIDFVPRNGSCTFSCRTIDKTCYWKQFEMLIYLQNIAVWWSLHSCFKKILFPNSQYKNQRYIENVKHYLYLNFIVF